MGKDEDKTIPRYFFSYQLTHSEISSDIHSKLTVDTAIHWLYYEGARYVLQTHSPCCERCDVSYGNVAFFMGQVFCGPLFSPFGIFHYILHKESLQK